MTPMMNQFFSRPSSLSNRRKGPLAPYLDGFAAQLSGQGYARHYGKWCLEIICAFSQWLGVKRLKVEELQERHLAAFLKSAIRTLSS